MSDTKRAVLDALLPASLPDPKPFEAYAPSNIALSKYWGKRDKALNLPLNSSLSISLGAWGSRTKVSAAENSIDQVWLNGECLDPETPFASKVSRFANLFRRDQKLPLHFVTENTVPTAAGLASSASGFAALTKAIAGAFDLQLPESQLSMISRMGSGSATRSFWHGFVRWNKGQALDGNDSFARPLNHKWPEFRIAIVPVDKGPKSKSSRDGMDHTVATSPLFEAWPRRAEADCQSIETAIEARDFETLGQTAEANALAMHATMLAARPALSYLKPGSWTILEKLWQARANGLQAYATMDAGPNIKLIFLEDAESDVRAEFPEAAVINPFDPVERQERFRPAD